MPSYGELDDEVWWVNEYEPPALAAFNSLLRAKYGLTRSQCGSKGDNRHLNGRHRSRNWDLNSQYCTNRSYGTTDARDKRGSGDVLRATDLGISGPVFWAACRRVDAAVRAGKLPQLAEWYGTFDGRTVVGWSNGRPSSSDSSHLTHGHFGYWNESANDEAFFDLLYATITGDDMALTFNERAVLDGIFNLYDEVTLDTDAVDDGKGTLKKFPVPITKAFKSLQADLDELKSRPPTLPAPVDAAVVAAAVKSALADPAVLASIAKAVADEDHKRSAA